MLRWLAILCLLAIATVGVLPGQKPPSDAPEQGISKADGCHSGSDNHQSESTKQPTPNPVVATSQPASPCCDETCQQGRENIAIQRKLVWFTLGLVIVGFLQVGTMYYQACLLRGTLNEIHTQAGHMERQTRAAVISAKAARRQTLISLNGQRAWVTAEIYQEGADPSDMHVWEKPGNYGLGVPVRITNIGATPARIMGSYARCELVRNADPHKLPHVPVLPDVPDYTTDAEQNRIMEKRRMLMPGQTYDHLITLSPQFFEQHLLQYRIADRLLCVYGFVRYETFGVERETRFCYAYLFNRPMGNLVNHKTGKPLFPPAYCVTGPEVYSRVT